VKVIICSKFMMPPVIKRGGAYFPSRINAFLINETDCRHRCHFAANKCWLPTSPRSFFILASAEVTPYNSAPQTSRGE